MKNNNQSTEKIELLTDVSVALRQIASGEGVSNRAAKAKLRERFAR